MSKGKGSSPDSKARSAADEKKKRQEAHARTVRGIRETVEAVVTAVILAFLFRAFEAEAFIIPTGSMAPTLQGRHFDVQCPKCDYWYRTGASKENQDGPQDRAEINHTTCPNCRYTRTLDKADDPNQRSFAGDRILVSKFAYEVGEPQRWDVIVFKYPGNAKQNYIKRLIGLPEEMLMIRGGDIYVLPLADEASGKDYRIARKPPVKVKTMLQVVHDADYIPRQLMKKEHGWPSRWHDAGPPDNLGWRDLDQGSRFVCQGGSDQGIAWLRYRHFVPTWQVWQYVVDVDERGRSRANKPAELTNPPLSLITDYYPYNDDTSTFFVPRPTPHWVGDLALECELTIVDDAGEIVLDLVEGGVHYQCRIDVGTGQATLSFQNGQGEFISDDGQGETSTAPTAKTRIRGPGRYDVRFANVDDQLLLWVNDRLVNFDGPTTYRSPAEVEPKWSPDDSGDAMPVGIGSRGAKVEVAHLRVLRDVYYIATSPAFAEGHPSDYRFLPDDVSEILADHTKWSLSHLFPRRRSVEFRLERDEFLPMGDNSPSSKDARVWSDLSFSIRAQVGQIVRQYERRVVEALDSARSDDEQLRRALADLDEQLDKALAELTSIERIRERGEPPPFVERRYLTGKAVLIYWPHTWNRPIPYWPNFRGMKFIR